MTARLAALAALPLAGCGEGAAALWIEHGPGWWPLIALAVVLLLVWRRPGWLGEFGEITFFGLQLKRSIARIDDDAEGLADTVLALRRRVEALEARIGNGAGAASAEPAPEPPALGAHIDAMLRDPRFTWRSIDRLALESGATAEEVLDHLRAEPAKYRIGSSESGRQLARLRERR